MSAPRPTGDRCAEPPRPAAGAAAPPATRAAGLPCPPAHWPAFSRRLDALLDLPAAQRAAALAALPADEQLLAPWLAAVLAAEPGADDDDGFLAAPRLGAPAPALQAGQRVGPYALLHELGRGGMGVVWLARRADGAYLREVALKLPHAHLLAGAVRERFARERDILASLAHPHIARFYDAGLADDGQPYLALEAVHGQPITTWCRARGLALAGRLALFAQVTAAVGHAHGRLIAHRDLKPANVLVTAEGEVKLLDFGIAGLLQADGAGDERAAGNAGPGAPAAVPAGALTRAHGLLATPHYAAPEQLAGGPVSVATDVYALGLMLHELLTDQPAFTGTQRPGPDMPPPRPSRAVADARQRRALQGDLDAIVMQALQHAPERRYASVAALADDLDRHRRHLPIQARRIGWPQRAAMALRRHRLPAALAAGLALASAAGVAGIAWQAHEARAQARRAEAVTEFLLGVFSAADPRLPGGRPRGSTTAKELLDRATARIDSRFADDPPLRITLLRTAAEIYRELGEDAAYQALQQRQLALARQHFGPQHPNVLEDGVESALQAYQRGDLAACRQQLAAADTALRAARHDDSLLRAHWWLLRGMCLRDQAPLAAERLAAFEQALALFARLAPGQRGHVSALSELATEQLGRLQVDAAVQLTSQAIAMSLALPRRNEAELQTLYANLGQMHTQAGRLAEAAEALGQAAAVAERTSGGDFRTALVPRSLQARVLHLAGEREAAQQLFATLLARADAPGTPAPEANRLREDAGERLAAEGRPAEGLPLLRAAEAGYLRAAQFEFDLRRVRRHIGDALARMGRHDEALAVLQPLVAQFLAADGPGRQPLIALRERLGRLLLAMGRPAEAQAQFSQALRDADNPAWSHVALAHAGLARLALAAADLPAARRASDAALATWQRLDGFRDLRMQAYLWRVDALVLAAEGRAAEASARRAQALASARRSDAPGSPTLTDPEAPVL